MSQIQNPLLKKAMDELEKHVPKGQESVFAKIVLQAQKILYDDKTHYLMLEQMDQDIPPERIAGEGAAKLFGLMAVKFKGAMPMDVAVLALLIIMIEYLDFMEDAGRVKVDEEILAGSTRAYLVNVTQMMGISADKLAGLAQKGAEAQNNPAMGAPGQIELPPEQQTAQAPQGLVAGARQQPMMGG
jgi:hypothetical protein